MLMTFDTLDTRPSVVALNPKGEVSVPLVDATKAMGVMNLHVNPTGHFSHLTPDSNINFWHHISDAFWSENETHQKSVIPMARGAVNNLVPQAKRQDTEAGRFFIEGYKLAPEIYILSEIVDARVPYPAGLWVWLSDPQLFLCEIKRVASWKILGDSTRDKIASYVVAKAKTLLENYLNPDLKRYFEEFRSGAERHSSIYNNASHLASYGKDGSVPLRILRQKCCFLTIDTPLEHMDEYTQFQAQFVRALIEMAKLTPGRTIYLIAEEAGTALPEGIENDLTIIRGLNFRIDFIFQYEDQFGEKRGQQAQDALDSQIDVAINAGVSRSDEKAQRKLSERCGKTTEINSNVTQAVDGSGAGSVNVERRAKDLMTPLDVAEMPRNKMLAFVSNATGDGVKQPKAILDKVNYGQTLPHRDIVGFNPVENKPSLYSEDIAIHMEYEPGKEPVCLNAAQGPFGDDEVWTVEDEPFFTPYSFIWLGCLVLLTVLVELFTPFSILPF